MTKKCRLVLLICAPLSPCYASETLMDISWAEKHVKHDEELQRMLFEGNYGNDPHVTNINNNNQSCTNTVEASQKTTTKNSVIGSSYRIYSPAEELIEYLKSNQITIAITAFLSIYLVTQWYIWSLERAIKKMMGNACNTDYLAGKLKTYKRIVDLLKRYRVNGLFSYNEQDIH